MKLFRFKLLALRIILSVLAYSFSVQYAEAHKTEILQREELLFMDIPTVITATKTFQPSVEAPATIIVITKKQIKERGYNNLLDLMEDLPGVDLQNKAGEEWYNGVAVRGNNGKDKFIIMMDSYRVSSPTAENIPIAENFPLYNAKQVEIVFGPASALYGADAFAGVINIITDDAEDVDGLELSVSAGSFDYINNNFYYGKKISNNLKLSVGGHWQKSDNADLSRYYNEYNMNVDLAGLPGTAGTREGFSARTASYSGFLKMVIDDRFVLGFNRSFFRASTPAGTRPEYSYFSDDVKWETALSTYYGEYNFDAGEKVSGKSSLSFNTYELLPESKYKNLYVGFQDGYKYSHSKKFMFEQQVNYEMSERHTFVSGFSYENFYSLPKTADLNKPYDTDLPAEDQGLFYWGSDDTLPVKIFELNYKNYGAYVQAQSAWTDRISSTLGARYDYNTRYGSTVNPRGGIVSKVGDGTTLKLLYGEAYLSPSPYVSYAHYGSFQNMGGTYVGNYFRVPNPYLKPEKVRTTEFGISRQFLSALSVNLSTYYSRLSDIIRRAPIDPEDAGYINGAVITGNTKMKNIGNAEYYGGEFTFNYKKRHDGLVLEYWGSYSYVDGSVNEGPVHHKRPIYIANHKVKAGLTATIGGYYITPIIRWIGKTNSRSIDDTSLTTEEHVDDYLLVNLNVGVDDLVKNLSASINIHNLFDKRYYNAGSGGINFLSSPQEPRRIVLKVDYKL